MYTANKPLFEFLYAYIRENFFEGEIPESELVFYSDNASRPSKSDARFFRRVERGPIPLEHVEHPDYPLIWFELGEIRDVELDRSPQGYSYVLRYQTPFFVRHQLPHRGRIAHETFRSDDNLPRGVGNIVSEIVEKAWADLRVGFSPLGNFKVSPDGGFMLDVENGQFALSDTNWWIKNWSVDVNGDIVDTIAEWRDVLHNAPQSRAKTINWDFTIFEEQPLIS